MSENPGVKALDDVMEQIRIGAEPLELTETVTNEMRGRYKPDFDDSSNQEAWPSDKPRILVLSRLVGEVATFLTRADATLHGKPKPKAVDSECARWAGYLVARSICPRYQLMGRHCYRYPIPSFPFAPFIAGILRQIVQHALPPDEAGPATQ